jgi:O-antigen/teichoic acid export membrane protein
MQPASEAANALRSAPWAFVYTLVDRAGLALVLVGFAPLLGTKEIGLASISMAFVFLALTPAQGISDAVVQLPQESERKFGLLMVVSAVMAAVASGAIWAAAPMLAQRLGAPELAALVSIHSLVLLAAGVGAVPDGMLARRFQFRRQAIRKLVGTLIGIAVALAVAWQTRSALAVIVFHIISQFTSTAVAWQMVHRDVPLVVGAKLSMKEVGRFLASMGSQLLGQINLRSYDLIVGAALVVSAVGIWRMGYNLMLLVTAFTLAPAASLLLSTISQRVRQGGDFGRDFIVFHKYASALAIPTFAIVAAGMPFLMGAFLSDEWNDAILVGQILCVNGFANTISTLGLPALLASGHYRQHFQANLIAAALSVALALICAPFGVAATALSLVVKGLLSSAYVLWMLRSYTAFALRSLLSNFLAPVVTSAIAASSALLATELVASDSDVVNLAIFLSVFATSWTLATAVLFRPLAVEVLLGFRSAILPQPKPLNPNTSDGSGD